MPIPRIEPKTNNETKVMPTSNVVDYFSFTHCDRGVPSTPPAPWTRGPLSARESRRGAGAV